MKAPIPLSSCADLIRASTSLRRQVDGRGKPGHDGLLVLGLVLACLSTPAFANDPAPDRARELKEFVTQDCGSCHGMTMKGGLGLPLTRERLAEIPAEALAVAILDGRPGTPMPPWRGMVSEDEAGWIARYLKGETDVR